MHKPIKYAEKALTLAAGAAWYVFDKVNQIGQNPGFTPKWSDKPLLKSWEKTKPPLGWPRETDSLCPRCIPEIRKQFWTGKPPSISSITTNRARSKPRSSSATARS